MKQCVVVPKVYTRTEGNKVFELHGAEYDDAKEIFGEKVDEELSVMENLKRYRQNMRDITSNIQRTEDKMRKETLQEELKMATEN